MPPILASGVARARRTRRVAAVGSLSLVVGGCLGLVAVLVLSATHLNPFAVHESEGGDAVVLTKVHDLATFEAATGHFQTLVDQKKSSDVLPDWVSGRRQVLAAEGDVQATVDFSTLPAGAIQRSPDGKHATVHLPAPALSEPRLDPANTRVVGQERGVLDRIGDGVSDGTSTEVHELEQRATSKIAAAAEQSDLRERARTNTERFLRDVLKSTGVDDVTVVFDPAPAAST